MSTTKKDIMWRVWLMYGFICAFGIAIIGQVVKVKFVEGEKWRAKADSLELRMTTITPSRGNIYSSDGSLLATSTPIYELRIDTKAEAFKKDNFNAKIDSLSDGLSKIFGDKSAQEYKNILKTARRDKERYFLLKNQASFKQYKALQKLPIFNAGRYKGGLIVITDSRRDRPYNELAARTIGYKVLNVKPVGIEGAFDSCLSGVVGKRIMQKLAGGIYKPVNDENEIEPQDGMDVISTIDINIQDVAQQALYTQLSTHDAPYGCAILMEVKTGEIKAITNLTRGKDGKYYEGYNYAIGMGSEPGSTFKLASLVTAMDDGLIDLNDSVDISGGVAMFAGIPMKDSHVTNGKVSVQHAFEISSNVAVSKLITARYAKNPKQFTDGIISMHLNKKLGLEIPGEAEPRIPTPDDINKKFGWSKATLPFMSIGYETKLAPIQTLAFYNAIANGGKMVKPKFVKEIRQKGVLVKSFPTQVLVDSVCTAATCTKARKMMEGVVLHGTATNLKFETFQIAGKTGTARMSYGSKGYSINDSIRYQASFCGYFPADKPLYSCIVVIYELSPKFYTGNVVSGPVFKEIADKVYSTRIDMHKEVTFDSAYTTRLPLPKSGAAKPTQFLAAALNLKADMPADANWYQYNTATKKAKVLVVTATKVPDVKGMGLRDAIQLLESSGLNVKAIGRGAVSKQSIIPGTAIVKGQQIVIELT